MYQSLPGCDWGHLVETQLSFRHSAWEVKARQSKIAPDRLVFLPLILGLEKVLMMY